MRHKTSNELCDNCQWKLEHTAAAFDFFGATSNIWCRPNVELGAAIAGLVHIVPPPTVRGQRGGKAEGIGGQKKIVVIGLSTEEN